jgi:hypothetical protein
MVDAPKEPISATVTASGHSWKTEGIFSQWHCDIRAVHPRVPPSMRPSSDCSKIAKASNCCEVHPLSRAKRVVMSPARKRRFRRHSSLFELVSHFRFSRDKERRTQAALRTWTLCTPSRKSQPVHNFPPDCESKAKTHRSWSSTEHLPTSNTLAVLQIQKSRAVTIMEAPPQASDASPFSLQNQGKSAPLGHSTIIWLVVLACIIATAFVVIACLLCRCRRKRKDRRFSTGYGIYDGRHEFHPWNKNAAPPEPPVPVFGGYQVGKSTAEPIPPPSKANMRHSVRPSVMESMVVEEAGNDSGFKRSSKKTSRYYGGLGARISRMSQIGRAL